MGQDWVHLNKDDAIGERRRAVREFATLVMFFATIYVGAVYGHALLA